MSLLALLLALLLPTLILSSPPTIEHLPPTLLNNTLHRTLHINPVSRQARVRPCGRSCRFRLCNFNGTSRLLPFAPFVIQNDPNQPALPYVCLPANLLIGQVQSAGPARIVVNNRLTRLSSFSPAGLNAAFPNNFFRTATIPFLPFSGITRRGTVGNQWDFLHDRCLTLPIRRYRPLNPTNFRPGRVVNAGRGARNCVAFRTTAPTIQVQLTWDSNDDFDLMITEPDGDTVAFFDPRSEAGRLVGDNNVGFCSTDLLAGRENILYFPGGPIETGQYRIRVRHFNDCDSDVITNWRVVLNINGQRQRIWTGTANRGNNRVVLNRAFMFSG